MRMGGVTTIAEKKGAENERWQRTEVTLMDPKTSVSSCVTYVFYYYFTVLVFGFKVIY